MRGAGDDRIMSRHLAGDQPSTFRGVTSVSSEHSDGLGAGGNLLEGGGSNLHPSRMPMGNLAPTLRRSMPAVNAQQQQQNWGGTSQAQHKTASRHMSFSIDQQQQEEGEREKRRQLATNADEGEGPEEASARQRTAAAKDEQGSLSPSGSLVFTSAGPNFSPNRVMELGAAAMVQSSSRVLDTRQIQVFLKKREDSRATISTTLSDMTDFTSQSSQLQQRTSPAEVNSNSNNTNAVPPPQPAQTGNNTANSSVPLKHTRKVFHSSDTRSSIFSVSSSVDSAKEERIISNLEHTSAANNRVVVLPRPHPLLPSQQQHSLQVDHGSTGFEGDGGGSDADNSEERTRSSSAEHQRVSPIEGLNDNGRRPSVDSTTTKVVTAGGGSSPLSSWHSISELNSARHSDGGGGSEKRRPSTQILADRLDDSSSGKAEIWHSPPPPRPQSQASNRRSNYLGELVWQVDETVYCGGIEAAQNQNLLCRLNIEYIVDLSGQEDDPTLANSRPRTEYPCLCPKRTAHSRMTMSIRIKDDSHQQLLSRDSRPPIVDAKAQTMEREEIIHYFEALIDLIRKARISQKKVLIHSLKGRNRAPAFVAAYLMHCNRVTRVQAINKISKMMSSIRPGICISDTLQRALMRWQSILGIRAESSRLDSQQLNKMFAVKRTAWN